MKIGDTRSQIMVEQMQVNHSSADTLSSFQFETHMISTAIKELKNNRAPGSSGLSSKILKTFSDILTSPLTAIYNRSIQLETTFCPTFESILVPLPKSNFNNSPQTVRFISLNNIELKIFDGLLISLVKEFLEKKGFQSKAQHGGLKKKNCLTALIKMMFTAAKMLGRYPQNTVYIASLDYSSFFDSIDSAKLTRKLYDLGIRDQILYQIYMILTNREIRMRLDNHISQPTKVKNGIAQGAKSSTTLADIYTSSIGGEETQTKSKVVFIDDTLIIHCVQSNEEGTKEAQQHLNMIYKQSEELNLRLNGSKF